MQNAQTSRNPNLGGLASLQGNANVWASRFLPAKPVSTRAALISGKREDISIFYGAPSSASELPMGWRCSFLLSFSAAPSPRCNHLAKSRTSWGHLDISCRSQPCPCKKTSPARCRGGCDGKAPFPMKNGALLRARAWLAAALRLPGGCQEAGHSGLYF